MHKQLTYKAFKAQADHSYSTALSGKLPLFKGITWDKELSDYLLVAPITFMRTSKTASKNGNTYNILLNNLPSWQNFPLRQKSLIATTSLSTAKSFSVPFPAQGLTFGRTYRVLPKNMSTVVISPKSDIWYCFDDSLKQELEIDNTISLKQFNRYIAEIATALGFDNSFDKNWPLFNDFITALLKANCSSRKHLSKIARKLFDRLKDNKTDILGYLDRVLGPTKNDFRARVYSAHSNLRGLPDNEVWTDSCCLLVEEKVFQNL